MKPPGAGARGPQRPSLDKLRFSFGAIFQRTFFAVVLVFGFLFQLFQLAFDGVHPVGHGVGQVAVVQVDVGPGGGAAHDAAGVADHGTVIRYVLEHNGPRADLHMVADGDGTQYLGPGPHGDAPADGGVALAGVLAGAAQGGPLVDGHVVAYLGGFADHHAGAVVDEHALAQLRAGVNVDARALVGMEVDEPGPEIVAFQICPVRPPVGAHGLEARITEKDLPTGMNRRVAGDHRVQIPLQCVKHDRSPRKKTARLSFQRTAGRLDPLLLFWEIALTRRVRRGVLKFRLAAPGGTAWHGGTRFQPMTHPLFRRLIRAFFPFIARCYYMRENGKSQSPEKIRSGVTHELQIRIHPTAF